MARAGQACARLNPPYPAGDVGNSSGFSSCVEMMIPGCFADFVLTPQRAVCVFVCAHAHPFLPLVMQELFTSLMAKESFSVAQSQNRRLLKLQDITDIMHNQVSYGTAVVVVVVADAAAAAVYFVLSRFVVGSFASLTPPTPPTPSVARAFMLRLPMDS